MEVLHEAHTFFIYIYNIFWEPHKNADMKINRFPAVSCLKPIKLLILFSIIVKTIFSLFLFSEIFPKEGKKNKKRRIDKCL